MSKPNFESTKEYCFGRLERELAPNLFYHGIHHTRDDVLPAIERLGQIQKVGREDFLLLQTGALYHDIGYVEQYLKNEPIAIIIANETLPNFGYSNNQIEKISKMIMATQLQMIDGKLIQVPDSNDLLQQLICDADLDYLGRKDFFVIGENLRRELREYGMPKTLGEWCEVQISFQEAHSYFTNAAKSLRNEGKQSNIRELKELFGRP